MDNVSNLCPLTRLRRTFPARGTEVKTQNRKQKWTTAFTVEYGMSRRCLLAYKIYMQNGWDLWDTIEPKQILRKFRSIDFSGGIYGIDKRGRRFELSKHGKRSLYVKGNVTINILPPRFVFPFVNIYDKNGKLLSKMKKYRRGYIRARDLQEKR